MSTRSVISIEPTVKDNLKTQFIEEPCTILDDGLLRGNAFSAAMGYIPTARIKKWKPKDSTRVTDEDKFEYCYIDNDPQNNAQDRFMIGKECSLTNNRVFANMDFVNNAFEDNVVDNTRKMPFKKCVIKLDRSQINNRTLHNFWNTMDRVDCDQLFYPIQEENAKLSIDIKDRKSVLSVLRSQIKEKQLIINQGNNEINKIAFDLKECKNHQAAIYSEVQKAIDDRDKWKKDYANAVKRCDIKLQNMTDILNNCKTQLATHTNGYNTTKNAFDKLLIEHRQLNNMFEVTNNAYENLKAQHAFLMKSFNDLQEKHRDLLPLWRACRDELPVCQRNLANCNNQTAQLNSQKNTYTTNLRQCYAELDVCRNSVRECDIVRVRLTGELKELMNRSFECTNTLRTCNQDVAAKKITTRDLAEIIKSLQISRPVCSEEQGVLAALQSEMNTHLRICSTNANTTSLYQRGIQALQTALTRARSTKLQTCAQQAMHAADNMPPPEEPNVIERTFNNIGIDTGNPYPYPTHISASEYPIAIIKSWALMPDSGNRGEPHRHAPTVNQQDGKWVLSIDRKGYGDKWTMTVIFKKK
jgi:hypothetical protein